MAGERGINGGRQNPQLCDIDHDQHDQPRLPDGCLSALRS